MQHYYLATKACIIRGVDHWKNSVRDFEILRDFAEDFRISGKISRFQERFQDFREDFKISGKISRFQERFQDLVEISRFHVRFQDFQKDYARFLARFQRRFLQDFQILVQILTYWFWISRWCDYLLHTCSVTVYMQAGTYIHQYTIFRDTDTMYKQVIAIYMHACSWWGLVLAETRPAQWVTLHNI